MVTLTISLIYPTFLESTLPCPVEDGILKTECQSSRSAINAGGGEGARQREPAITVLGTNAAHRPASLNRRLPAGRLTFRRVRLGPRRFSGCGGRFSLPRRLQRPLWRLPRNRPALELGNRSRGHSKPHGGDLACQRPFRAQGTSLSCAPVAFLGCRFCPPPPPVCNYFSWGSNERQNSGLEQTEKSRSHLRMVQTRDRIIEEDAATRMCLLFFGPIVWSCQWSPYRGFSS